MEGPRNKIKAELKEEKLDMHDSYFKQEREYVFERTFIARDFSHRVNLASRSRSSSFSETLRTETWPGI